MRKPITRRTALRGLGTTLALPWLEAMRPIARAAGADGPPLRMAFFYVPNGVRMETWTPESTGADFKLPAILEPLTAFRDDMLVLTGLAQDNAFAHGDGPGDHARSLACFLTGVHPVKTDGADIRVGVSVDQVCAQRIGRFTKLPSLELGIEEGRQAGGCDSGYSCAYSSNISWRSPTTPVPKEINPRLVFERLFGGDDPNESAESRARRQHFRTSILDFVNRDASRLADRLGRNDRRKMDEYLTSVRELEVRVARSEAGGDASAARGLEKPGGIPSTPAEHYRLMNDLMLLAFQADLTRVATFMYANEGSNRNYPDLGVTDGHHELSHHGGDEEKLAKIQKINTFHIQQFAHLVGRLKETKEGDGNLLDHSMLVYGSGIGDGNRHNHNDLPVLLLGRGGGAISTGRHIEYPRNTPLNNLFLTMLDRMGTPVESLGDSTGRLSNLGG